MRRVKNDTLFCFTLVGTAAAATTFAVPALMAVLVTFFVPPDVKKKTSDGMIEKTPASPSKENVTPLCHHSRHRLRED